MKTITHSSACTMAFGRFTKTEGACPRCDELKNGAAARAGWQTQYFSKKKQDELRRSHEIKNHDCVKAGCNPICCTFGDW